MKKWKTITHHIATGESFGDGDYGSEAITFIDIRAYNELKTKLSEALSFLNNINGHMKDNAMDQWLSAFIEEARTVLEET